MLSLLVPGNKTSARSAGPLSVGRNCSLSDGLVLVHTCRSLREKSQLFGEQFSPTSTPSLRPRGILFTADAQYVSAEIRGTNNIRTDLPITVLVIGSCSVSNTTRKRLLKLSEPNGTVVNIDFGDGTSNVVVFGLRYGTSTYSNAASYGFAPVANKKYVVVGRHKPGEYPELYVDGVLRGTGSVLATMHLPPTTVTLGSNSGSSTFNGTEELVLVWNRYLSVAEINSISANPYQVTGSWMVNSDLLLTGAYQALSGAASLLATSALINSGTKSGSGETVLQGVPGAALSMTRNSSTSAVVNATSNITAVSYKAAKATALVLASSMFSLVGDKSTKGSSTLSVGASVASYGVKGTKGSVALAALATLISSGATVETKTGTSALVAVGLLICEGIKSSKSASLVPGVGQITGAGAKRGSCSTSISAGTELEAWATKSAAYTASMAAVMSTAVGGAKHTSGSATLSVAAVITSAGFEGLRTTIGHLINILLVWSSAVLEVPVEVPSHIIDLEVEVHTL